MMYMEDRDNIIYLADYRDPDERREARVAKEKRKTDMQLVRKYGETALAATSALMYFTAHGAGEVKDTANDLLAKIIAATQDPPPGKPPAS